MVVLSLLLSCEVPVSYVTMSGSVFSGPLDIAEPVPQMALRSRDMGLSLWTRHHGQRGAFEIELPAGGYFFLSMEETATNLTGISGVFSVEDGIIWARQESVMREIEQLFEAVQEGRGRRH